MPSPHVLVEKKKTTTHAASERKRKFESAGGVEA